MADKVTPDDIIEIPSDEIQLGADADGLPKTIAGDKVATGKPIEAEADDSAGKEAARIAEIEKERDEARAEADRHAREAAAERTRAAEALELASRRGQDLDKRTGEAVGAHRARVRSDYEKVYGDYERITSGIGSAQAMLAQAETDLATAHTNGDAVRIAQLTSHVGKLSGQLSQLESLKPNAEAYLQEAKSTWEDTERAVADIARKRSEAPEPEARPAAKGPKDFRDFADNYSDQWIDSSPRAAQSWLRKHKDEVIKDPEKFERLNAFANHYKAKHKNLESSGFVEALDAEFFPDESKVADEHDEVVEEKPRAKRVAAAPVTRGTVYSSRNPSSRLVKLPPDVAAFVRQANLDPQKYAEEVLKEIKEGKKHEQWLDPDFDRGFR